MDIREIARERWSTFFDRFSQDHAGREVKLEAYGPGTNPHDEAHALPFVGITYEPKSDDIEIILGTEIDDHISHTVTRPMHVWVRPEATGDIVEIRSEDGVTVLLRISAH